MATTLAPTAETSVFQTIHSTVPLERSEPFGQNWTSYSAKALHSIVCDSVKELTALSRRGQTELRQRLLPALQEVRRRIAKGETIDGYDTVTDYLSAVGLSEGVIRKWEFRLREKELKELGLDEKAAVPNVETNPVPDAEELAALLTPLECEPQPASEPIEASATEIMPPQSDTVRLRQFFKGTSIEVKQSIHGNKFLLDGLSFAQCREIATMLVSE